jgi:hypothetical protein
LRACWSSNPVVRAVATCAPAFVAQRYPRCCWSGWTVGGGFERAFERACAALIDEFRSATSSRVTVTGPRERARGANDRPYEQSGKRNAPMRVCHGRVSALGGAGNGTPERA